MRQEVRLLVCAWRNLVFFLFFASNDYQKVSRADRVALTLGYRRGRRVPPICSQSGTKNHEEALFLYMHYARIYILYELQESPRWHASTRTLNVRILIASRFSLLPPLLSMHNLFDALNEKDWPRIFTLGFTLVFQARFIYFSSSLFLFSFTGKSLCISSSGNRTYSVFHAGHTYPSTGFVLLGLNEILFLPCAAAKAKSREVRVHMCVCGIFEFFKFCTLSLSPLSVATSVFNFLWITLSSQLSTPGIPYTHVCYSSRERVRVPHFRRAFTRYSFAPGNINAKLVRKSIEESLNRGFHCKYLCF